MDKIEQARLEQLEKHIPDIWDYKKVLYIGAGPYRSHFFDVMKVNNCLVDVVEIDEDNCLWLLQTQQWLQSVLNLDIVDFLTTEPDLEAYDMILWSHGIECLSKEEGGGIIRHYLEQFVKPGGIIAHLVPHGEAGGTGNICAWFPDEFKKLGYNTDCLGSRGERNSNLLAWKHIK